MATRDYRSTAKAQAPPALPSWMLDLSGQEQQQFGSQSPQYNPGGYAEMDQYQNGGIPPAGSLGELIANNYQHVTSIDPQGYAVQGSEPTFGDRMGRAAGGALAGYDFGNTAANIGADVGASLVPGGQVVNSAAGAIQGYKDNSLDFNRLTPQGTGQGPSINQPDVMPRGIYGGGLLDPTSNAPANESNGGGFAPSPAFAANPVASRPQLHGQKTLAQAQGQFTGGSGALVDPYTLPAQDSLEGLLANAQRYADYDASTGRVGASGDGTGGYASRGFDFGQDAGNRDIGKSAKYAFAHLAKQASAAGVPQPRTKPEAEAWFTQHIAPGLGQLGYQVEWVKGDKARIHTREGVDEIDYLGNAGGEGEIPLTWQSEVLAPGSGMQGGGMGMGVGSLPTSGMDLSSSAFFDTLMQQARDIASGKTNGASLLDTNALLALLGK
jgi:hypothetical protein